MNTKKKITILHLWSSFKGDYELFNQVVMGLSEGYHHIICYMTGEAPEHEILHDAGYDVRWLGYTKKDLRTFCVGAVRRISGIISEENIDIIHAHRHKATFYAALTARKHHNVKVVSSVHGLKRSRGFFRKITNKLFWPRVNKIIAVSEAVKKDILQENSWFPPERVEVVYNGIDVEHFRNARFGKTEARNFFSLPEDAWIWGAVGRLAPVKGHEVLFRAWAGSGLGKMGCHLALAGDGDLHESLVILADDLGIADQVTFLGHISDVPEFLKALDGFVMPSLHEGFGLALVEALAAKIPVVASAVGGIPEILSDLDKKGHSFLVPAGNEKKLGAAMLEMVSWPENEYQQVVNTVSEHALRFKAQGMLEHMDNVYRELIAP